MAETAVREEISVKKLADGLDVSVQLLNRLAAQGVIAKTKYGHCDLWESIRGFVKYREEVESRRAQPEETNPGERVKVERARKLRLENDQTELRLIDLELARAAVDLIVGQLRTDLMGVPARVSGDVAIRKRVEDAINEVLAEHSRRSEQAGAALAEGRDPFATLDADDA